MKEERIAQKWRLIKLSKTTPLLAYKLAIVLSEKFGEEAYRIAFDYGRERGEEIARNLKLRSFAEIAKFLSMISGAKFVAEEDGVLYLSCPVNALEQLKSMTVCKGFIEGFFSAFGIEVNASTRCGEQCRVFVRKTRP